MNKPPKSFTMIPIPRTDIYQTIISRIGQLIDSSLNTGDRLPSERELADNLGVSRTSVRQALKVPESVGKVETRVGSGTYVAKQGAAAEVPLAQEFADVPVDKSFLRKLIVARVAIEKAVFEDSFDKIDSFQIGELNLLLQDNALELASDAYDAAEGLDLSFESKVAEFGRNEILIGMQQQIHRLWMQSWQKFGFIPGERKALHQEHLEIMAALVKKDKKKTLELIVRHVEKEID